MYKMIKLTSTNISIFIYIVFGVFTYTLSGESIKDYFIPKYPLKNATFIIKNTNKGIAGSPCVCPVLIN